ncbi:zinc finger protein 593-like [Ostrea edulis]|uniref:zinc finger protein 593-like n=1 Tax=Ostrea edulis TaxID=37623 RepID=UPI00209570B7|nr:zinc finger protein 593-like [Ostrea edulis]XP_048769204.1 zinc finger protein 593-like [Ostrea edulis]XP_048769205.1 zinc finger protein 593-like [Ostrea edulis]
MGRLARKRHHKGDKPIKEKYRTKRKTKDLDEIHDDMQPEKSQKLINQEKDFDKPGAGQFYCLHCAKYFINEDSLKTHFRSKPHKRRLKALSVEPYTQEEADRAAGIGSYKAPKKVAVETQSTNMDTDNT